MTDISSRSAGPTVDGLELKLSGATALGLDLPRSQEVEVVLRGVIVGHAFDDKRDGNGDISHTVKSIKLKADELVEITALHGSRFAGPNQTHMDDDGVTRDARGEAVSEQEEIHEAEVVGELTGEVMDPETGEIIPPQLEAGEEEEASSAPDRHPQIPEAEWDTLNLEQKEEVLGLVLHMEKLAEAHAQATNPTDEGVAEKLLGEHALRLADDFGIVLLEPSEVPEAPADEPAPPSISADSPPVGRATLLKRKTYLESRAGLPQEALEAKDAELEEIARRLKAMGKAA